MLLTHYLVNVRMADGGRSDLEPAGGAVTAVVVSIACCRHASQKRCPLLHCT